MSEIEKFNKRVEQCRECPRLVTWREQVAREKRASFRNDTYWGKPLSGFGDPEASLVILGLAPAAHGANRTGRMFTGDRSGEWLYRALHKAGFGNQPESISRNDGLVLHNAYITAVVRCAPPENKPTTGERDQCIHYLEEEMQLLTKASVILALGNFAWNGALHYLKQQGHPLRPKPTFGHGAEVNVGHITLLGSFHPSQQNTFTGKLTEPMFDRVFERASALVNESCQSTGK